MATKESLKVVVSASILLWLGLMLAPVLMAAEAWEEIEHPTLDFLFADTAAPNRAYQEVFLDTVSVWYPDTKRQGSQQAEALRRSASEYFQEALSSRGLTLVKSPNATALIVQVQLIDLNNAPISAEVLEWARGFRFRVQPGHMTLVAEFRDASTGRVLVRLADLADVGDDSDALLSSVDRALEHWGEVVAARIAASAGNVTLASIQQ